MELKPGQPVFIKEVHGNIWKTGTIDQPAKEPDSYWVKVSRQFHPEKDLSDDQAEVITFSFLSWRLRAEKGTCQNAEPPR